MRGSIGRADRALLILKYVLRSKNRRAKPPWASPNHFLMVAVRNIKIFFGRARKSSSSDEEVPIDALSGDSGWVWIEPDKQFNPVAKEEKRRR